LAGIARVLDIRANSDQGPGAEMVASPLERMRRLPDAGGIDGSVGVAYGFQAFVEVRQEDGNYRRTNSSSPLSLRRASAAGSTGGGSFTAGIDAAASE
jgi:hypothetical protein